MHTALNAPEPVRLEGQSVSPEGCRIQNDVHVAVPEISGTCFWAGV